MAYNPNIPYNDLRPLPPEVGIETTAVLRKTTTAARKLAELKGLAETIPNPAMLVDTIVLQEAKASSDIENIITTNDELFKALAVGNANIDASTKEVLRYREALWKGYNVIKDKPISWVSFYSILVQVLLGADVGVRSAIPNHHTVVQNQRTGEVIYTPPEGEDVIQTMLSELGRFMETQYDFDPLIKSALIHYQFEAIHPFPDGNGRTGRIINILYLVHEGLLDVPVLYLSKYIIDNKPLYYKLLKGVTENAAWEPWVIYMLDAIEKTAAFTISRISDIRTLIDDTLTLAKTELPSNYPATELIEVIFRQPYTKIKFIVESGIAKRQTAAKYLKGLEKIGILESRTVGRETLYLNVELFRLLGS